MPERGLDPDLVYRARDHAQHLHQVRQAVGGGRESGDPRQTELRLRGEIGATDPKREASEGLRGDGRFVGHGDNSDDADLYKVQL